MSHHDERALEEGHAKLKKALFASAYMKAVKINNAFKDGESTAAVQVVMEIPYREDIAKSAAMLAGKDYIEVVITSETEFVFRQYGIMKSSSAVNSISKDGEITTGLKLVFEFGFDVHRARELMELIGVEERVDLTANIVQTEIE